MRGAEYFVRTMTKPAAVESFALPASGARPKAQATMQGICGES